MGPHAADYTARINRVLDHIDAHLTEPLPLDALARVACFSPCHFHRVFQGMTGERPLELVRRRRLERAIALLSRPNRQRMHAIALAVGFGSAEQFSRVFKAEIGVPPSRFDPVAHQLEGRARFAERVSETPAAPWTPGANPDGFVAEVVHRRAHRLAYIRVLDPSAGDMEPALRRLVAWGEQQGLSGPPLSGRSLDDPAVTPMAHYRFDWCLEVPDHTAPDGEIAVRDVPALRWATVPMCGPTSLEQRALDYLFGTWLPTSDLEPAQEPMAEWYRRSPLELGWQTFDLTVALPVVAVDGA